LLEIKIIPSGVSVMSKMTRKKEKEKEKEKEKGKEKVETALIEKRRKSTIGP
jgi:6,7-dimethyl-8-ribityllumazine synthase